MQGRAIWLLERSHLKSGPGKKDIHNIHMPAKSISNHTSLMSGCYAYSLSRNRTWISGGVQAIPSDGPSRLLLLCEMPFTPPFLLLVRADPISKCV